MQSEEWLYGLNPVLEALRAGRKIEAVFLYGERHKGTAEIRRLAEAGHIPVILEGQAFFDGRFPKGHQGVAAKVFAKLYIPFEELIEIPGRKKETPFFLVIDLIEDPRNLGAIARSAEAGGVHGIVLQKYRAVGLSPAVYRTSSGALEYIPVAEMPNIKNAIREFKGHNITIVGGEAGSGLTPWEADLSCPIALVIGSEGRGLRKTVREMCDLLVSLPILGRVNSLNVSVAAGILIYEVLRQRRRS